eukprot:CAMPEP_0113561234 /NCGR_PEP_ID=MMETSP0015_2-20120614/19868_1 /TAXON_ID=2838 /ORGANISM="Odontella" /LENGTH=357 /DNA_ID=CAMNT_0000463017 /DNA_START=896 /DNA_END=1966 /DNA_ORIENTATION=- /assembly_acc=CAM_ASM_000160
MAPTRPVTDLEGDARFRNLRTIKGHKGASRSVQILALPSTFSVRPSADLANARPNRPATSAPVSPFQTTNRNWSVCENDAEEIMSGDGQREKRRAGQIRHGERQRPPPRPRIERAHFDNFWTDTGSPRRQRSPSATTGAKLPRSKTVQALTVDRGTDVTSIDSTGNIFSDMCVSPIWNPPSPPPSLSDALWEDGPAIELSPPSNPLSLLIVAGPFVGDPSISLLVPDLHALVRPSEPFNRSNRSAWNRRRSVEPRKHGSASAVSSSREGLDAHEDGGAEIDLSCLRERRNESPSSSPSALTSFLGASRDPPVASTSSGILGASLAHSIEQRRFTPWKKMKADLGWDSSSTTRGAPIE